jgi:hypothetical protein
MTHDEILREIALLPPEGQHQVIDFIAFMRQRYRSSTLTEPSNSDLNAESFIGIWQDRDELKDSSAWVRNAREAEWTK